MMNSEVVSTSTGPNVAVIVVLLLAALVSSLFAFSIFWNRFARSTRVADLESGGVKSWNADKGLLAPQRKNSLPFPAPPPYPGQDLTILPPPPAYLTSDSLNSQPHTPTSASLSTRDGSSHNESGAVLLFVVPAEVPLYSLSETSPSLYSPMRSSHLPSSEGIVAPNPAATSSDAACPNLGSRQSQT